MIEFIDKETRDRYVAHDPHNRQKCNDDRFDHAVTYSCLNCVHCILDCGKLSKSIICTLNGWEERFWILWDDPGYPAIDEPESRAARKEFCIHFDPVRSQA